MALRGICHASAHQPGWLGTMAGAEAGVDAAGLPDALADGFDIADELAVGAGVGVTSSV